MLAGVCLVTLPPRAVENNNNHSVVTAATEVINGLTFETIYLTGSQAANLAQMQAHQNISKNYRYVLQADWTVTANPSGAHNDLFGNYVMIDLNGYTINGSLTFTCTTAEITDSSPRRTGTWTNESSQICHCWEQVTKLIISGGNLLDCHLAFALNNAAIQINGGNFTVDAGNKFFTDTYTNYNYTHAISFAPWVTPIYQNDTVMAFSSDDFFAVSTTDLVSGVYNYAYGYAWELTASQLSNLEIPTDKTYHLWARNAGGWYQYLNLRYVDGAWRNAA